MPKRNNLHRVRSAAGRAGAVARWSAQDREQTCQIRVYKRDAEALKSMPGTVAQAVRALLEGAR